jgi:hypothetical protein
MALDGLPIGNSTTVQHLVGLQDFFEPEVAADVVRRFGGGVTLTLLMNSMDRWMPVSRDTWKRFEEGQYHRPFKVNADTTGGAAGAAVDIVLSAADVDANDQYYPRRGFIIGIPVGQETMMAIINDITEAGSTITLSVKPYDVTVAIPILSAGTELSVLSHAKAPGTDQPDPSRMNYVDRDYQLQISAETITADGTTITDQTWAKRFDDGAQVMNIWNPEFARAELLMDQYLDTAAFLGQLNTNSITQTADNMNSSSSTAGIGNTIDTTKGLFTWNREVGAEVEYTDGSWALTDLDDVEDHMRSQGINTGTIMHLVGSVLKRQIDIAAQAKIATVTGGELFLGVVNTYFGGSKSLSLSLGFDVVKNTSYTHVFQVIDTFDNPWFMGAGGYNTSKRGLAFPISDVPVLNEERTKVMLPNINLRYKELNGYSRRREMWLNGAAGRGMYLTDYIGQTDALSAFWRSHWGLEALQMNQTVVYNPA